MDQDKLTVRSGIIGSRIRNNWWTEIIGGKFSNSKYFMFTKKRDNLFSRYVKTFLAEKGVFDARLLSIKDGHEGDCKTLNEGLIPKGY